MTLTTIRNYTTSGDLTHPSLSECEKGSPPAVRFRRLARLAEMTHCRIIVRS